MSIKPGYYILRNNVVNPKGDRRTKRDFRLASTWDKGLRIRVRENKTEIDFVDGEPTNVLVRLELEAYHSNVYRYSRGILENDEHRRFEALAAALEPIQDGITLLAEAKERYVDSADLVDEFIIQGMSVDVIRACIRTIDTRQEAEYEAQEKAEEAEREAKKKAVEAALKVTSG